MVFSHLIRKEGLKSNVLRVRNASLASMHVFLTSLKERAREKEEEEEEG